MIAQIMPNGLISCIVRSRKLRVVEEFTLGCLGKGQVCNLYLQYRRVEVSIRALLLFHS